MRNLSDDKNKIVQAYGVLDQLDSGSDVTITVRGADGQEKTFECTPQVIEGMKSGLGGVLFGKTQNWTDDLRFDNKDDVATALDIEPDQLEGLAASDDQQSFSHDQIIPYLHQHAQSGVSEQAQA